MRRILDLACLLVGTGVYAIVWGLHEVSYAGLAVLLVFIVLVSAVLDVTAHVPRGPGEE